MTRTAPTASSSRASTLAVSLAAGLLALLALVPTASADVVFGTSGTGAGQTSNPRAVAVDRADGTVYVADSGNNRVTVFDEDGDFLRAFGWGVADGTTEEPQTCTASCFKGIAGFGGGQFSGVDAIAVDNDPASPSYRDVYVFNDVTDSSRVQRFTPSGEFVLAFGDEVNETTGGDVCTAASEDVCGAGTAGSEPGQLASGSRIAMGAGGVVHVLGGPNRLQRFAATGAFVEELALLPAGLGSNVNGFAVDAAGNFYTGSAGGTGAVRKYDPSGALLDTFNQSFNIMDIAVDAAGNVYVSDAQSGYEGRAIFQYDASGVLLRVFYGEVPHRYISLAPYSNAGGDVFAVDENEAIVHVPFPPPGPIVAPGVTRASAVGNQKATLNAAINPEGEATTYHFDYVDQEEFEAEGFATPESTPETAVGSDFELHSVSREIGSLEPQTTYHFRAVATSNDGTDIGPEVSFTTLAPFEIKATWSTGVDTSSATLHAEVNPLGIPASGYFEYVDDATYKASGFSDAAEAPNVSGGESPLSFGAGEDPKVVHAPLQSLQPDTTYHYRIVVEDSFVGEPGPERTLMTYGLPGQLPTNCPNQAFRTGAGARLPDCRAYEMVSPVDKNNGDVATGVASFDQAAAGGQRVSFSSWTAFAGAQGNPLSNQYLASRDPQSGWSTRSINPPRSSISLYPTGGTGAFQYRAFSPDLCSGWLVQDVDVALTPTAPPGVANLYRRSFCGQGGYELLTTVAPPGFGYEPVASTYYHVIQGFSADKSRSVFRADAALTPNAFPQKEIFQVYMAYDGGKLRLISALPNGAAASTHSSAGTAQGPTEGEFRSDSVDNAVSADGSRVFWSASDDTIVPGGGLQGRTGRLFLRLNASEAQSQISGGKCSQPTRACTIEISGSLATRFLGADPQGTRAIYTIGETLHEATIEEVGGETVAASQQIAGGVKGLMGTSEDLSRIYLVSSEVLEEGASAGKRNLYLYERGVGFEFVATLGDHLRDSRSFSSLPGQRTARVTPDGLRVLFVSSASLTGYDNTDVSSGEADGEVFLYDAGADGGAGELLCVSCKPSGARPSGDVIGACPQQICQWFAATIPGWESTLHPSRVLSEDGRRVFFESFDALVLGDTNGKRDVYQWEAPGTGSCTTQSASYFEANSGCLSLISSGTSDSDSELFDATPSGSGVFFATNSSLLPQDPGLVDVYQAKVNGGFPPPPPPPPPCVGDACQVVPAPPNDPTPASAAFRGAGNVRASANCGAPARRARKLSRKAKRARRAAKRAAAAKRGRAAKRAKQMRRRSVRMGRKARRLSKRAKRCRTPNRANRANRANRNRGGSR